MRIRKAAARDAAPIVSLVRRTMLERDALHCRSQLKLYFSLGRAKLRQLGINLLVAKEKRILGFICSRNDRNTENAVWIDWLAVDPASQCKGIGTSLLKKIEETRPSHLLLVTSPFAVHRAARKFYTASGFKKAAVIPRYFAADEDGLLFVKTISTGRQF